MILQALKEYYDRKPDLPPFGFEEKEIAYIISLAPDGTPVSLVSTHEGEGKERRAKSYLAPLSKKRSTDISANLLWDNPEYVLGVALKDKKRSDSKTEEEIQHRLAQQHAAFIKRIHDLGEIEDEGLQAVKYFLQMKNKELLLSKYGDAWEDLLKSGANLSFKLSEDDCLVFERPAVKETIQKTFVKNAEFLVV